MQCFIFFCRLLVIIVEFFLQTAEEIGPSNASTKCQRKKERTGTNQQSDTRLVSNT